MKTKGILFQTPTRTSNFRSKFLSDFSTKIPSNSIILLTLRILTQEVAKRESKKSKEKEEAGDREKEKIE